ncbi:MAG: DUF5320 domain-containing protein [Theionarchaea archaeon]|nr:DUF5320 domain-containing protein [Theionarchaea archaeon]MBU7038738.1 DUF5320 domain-containing protein [Theionarchaea archaeon]
MPRGDGIGPSGEGPRTGRAAGYCAGYRVPGFANAWPGHGFWGGGRGCRRVWRADFMPRHVVPPYHIPSYPASMYASSQIDPTEEIAYLEQVAANIKKELEAVEARMRELKQEP